MGLNHAVNTVVFDQGRHILIKLRYYINQYTTKLPHAVLD